MARLEALEREEEALVAQAAAEGLFDESDEEDVELDSRASRVQAMQRQKRLENMHRRLGDAHRIEKKTQVARTADDLAAHLVSLGIDPTLAAEAAKSAAAKTRKANSVAGVVRAERRLREEEAEADP